MTQGGTPDTSIEMYWGGIFQWITPAEMGKAESPYVVRTIRTITKKGLEKCSSELLPEDSVIISTRAPIGHLAINKLPMAINQGCRGLIPFPETDNHFIYYYLLQSRAVLNDLGSGNTFKELSGALLKGFSIAIPSRAEQQTIADCLSSLDELISAQARKVDALQTHKKGLMQQLFPRKGETQPRLRFSEFWNAGEWAREELSRCLERVIDYRGKAPPKSESGVPLITARNVRFGWLDMRIDEYIEADDYKSWMSKGIPKSGDILFTTEAPLGNVALFPSAGKFALGQRIITLRTNSGKCVSEFLFQSLLGPQSQQEVDFHSTGSTAKGIKSSVFATIGLCYPGLQEQRRIADCLTSLDDHITAATQELDTLKAHKKGLMQQLFASADAVAA